ncbi:neuronal PAS domain-containing protein 2-like isoform X3 [Scleropages formosus]|uniref:neuronal PAS domain-containing protein 2-like isoform X3 n=1 Tax=Scleropages formosus TaxID=113540 RepID=UPI0010FA6A09|nr:neuronal PAS domain-containing protein 2-like isoform X3 [Scleropages formosus]
MDNAGALEGHCPPGQRQWDTDGSVDDLLEEDEKGRAKRASRNKSEKKRRDQFNVLIKELCTMLQAQGCPRKMDKSTILQRTIDFLEKQKEITAKTESFEIHQDWKPLFLCNEEFTQLMLEALDGFLIALTTDGIIIYVSDSVSSLIGHLPSDMVDQNILNFLPECEHGEVYKLLSTHMLMADPIAVDLLEIGGITGFSGSQKGAVHTDVEQPRVTTVMNNKNTLTDEMHIEFCCHLARGNMDPKEAPTYEYVKFVGDFKFHNYVPTMSCNRFELALPRALQSSLEEQVCLVATVRLATPQFLKDLCSVDNPCDEFTSRHSLEWKFLFLDHRASPIIGYLPFEVLGTSGYDYYHADDLELIAECHRQLMQFGKGKSCYYRFLTKGQQWIWLQTHYYITYHQWNSKPEFIVCTHTVISYAEVRSERRRELGLEESLSEMTPSSLIKSHDVYLDFHQEVPGGRVSRARSMSSHSSRKSSHTAMSDSASNSSFKFTETSMPSRQSMLMVPEKSRSRTQVNSLKTLVRSQSSSSLLPPPMAPLSPPCSQHSLMPLYQFQLPQLGMVHQLKEQLEERTRVLQADIQTQQKELHSIKEQLQQVNCSNLQQPVPLGFSHAQQGPGRPSQQLQQHQPKQPAVGSEHLCSLHNSLPPSLSSSSSQSQAAVQVQETPICSTQGQASSFPLQTYSSMTMPLYSNPMMFSQTAGRPLPLLLPSAQDVSQRHPNTDFDQDGHLRMLLNQPIQPMIPHSSGTPQASQCSTAAQQTKYTAEQQVVAAPLPMQQVNCSTLIVPSPVFTSPIVIPHNSFLSHQAQPVYPQQPLPPQALLPQQQQHFFQQVQSPGLLNSGQTHTLFHAAHMSQQSNIRYTEVPQQPRQHHHHHHHHLQSQAADVPDVLCMQLPQ